PPHRPVDSKTLPEGFEPFEIQHGERRLGGFTGGEGDLALLVHGWGGTARQMLPLATRLVESGYRVVATDLPGHGSDRRRRSDVLQMAAGLKTVIDRVGDVDVLVTHSLGAPVSALAMNEPKPRSVLLAPVLGLDDTVDGFGAMLGLGSEVVADLRKRIHGFLADSRATIEMDDSLSWGNEIMIIHDSEDRSTPVTASRRLASVSAEVTLVETTGLGHNRIVADDVVGAQIVDFLGDRSRTAPADLP
ncbi:MAG: alpha/beta fold hydrolase, partial [Acidimicrobiia bacterium]|nr:alpha/beta fold hydrolase [Acidimicrobiia bacterium]